jgi:hypothetical protein
MPFPFVECVLLYSHSQRSTATKQCTREPSMIGVGAQGKAPKLSSPPAVSFVSGAATAPGETCSSVPAQDHERHYSYNIAAL